MVERCPYCGKQTFIYLWHADAGCEHFSYVSRDGSASWNSSPHGDPDSWWGNIADEPIVLNMEYLIRDREIE